MNILMVAINDPAGTAVAFADAVNQCSEHFCRVATLETRYNHGWKKDLHVPDLDEAGLDELRDELRRADVLHFHMTADEHLRLGPIDLRDHLRGKAVVHHHHGHPDFRGNPQKYQDKYAALGRTNLLVSTPDLLPLLPGARWQPNLVDEQAPEHQPLDHKPDAPLRIAHSPTRRDLKNTDDLLRVLRELHAAGRGLALDVIDDAPHADCLERKRRCHVCFDHMQGYYGMSSLEALAQGLPTIAGLSDWCMAHMREFAQTDDLPWLVARTPETLRATLSTLADDPALRTHTAQASRHFMERHWSRSRVLDRLVGFWRSL